MLPVAIDAGVTVVDVLIREAPLVMGEIAEEGVGITVPLNGWVLGLPADWRLVCTDYRVESAKIEGV